MTPLTPFTETGTLVSFAVVTSIASLKVSTTAPPTDTLLAPFAGLTVNTDGVVVFALGELPVVKLLVNGTTAFPDWSVNPLAATEYDVFAASRLDGTNVNVVPAIFRVAVPGTAVPPADRIIELLFTLATSTCVLTVRSTRGLTGTLFAPLGGLDDVIVGPEPSFATPVEKLEPEFHMRLPSMSLIPLAVM